MLPKNVKFISTRRYLAGGASAGGFANFNLSTNTGDNPAAVEQNRALLLKHYNLPNPPKWLLQTHSNICLDASSDDCQADASITNKSGVVCSILTADCLPIFAANKSGTQVGVAHAGWQGIVNGVIEEFISKFSAADLQVHFGPAISPKAFEVGEDLQQKFIQKDSKLQAAFTPKYTPKSTPKSGKFQLDIYQAARIILNDLGVKSISGGGECTFCQADEYFSYRRDGEKSGRMAHLIWIS
ncbi:MAG: peptidoglycan editing factor PgeF [Candidatus Thioglobus sp.]|nr:peptidoglycan editing factor PgeF [Candidatus Thioglobus sp.]